MEQEIANKLFGKHPFIYYIDGKYYAIGSGVCSERRTEVYLTMASRFNDYLEAFNADISDNEAWALFRKVITLAEPDSDEEGEVNCVTKLENKLIQFGFSDKDIEELSNQLNRYEEFWERHHLEQYVNGWLFWPSRRS